MRVLFLIILSLMLNGYSWAYLTAGKIAVTATSSSSGVPSTSQDSDITDTKGSSVSVGVPVAVTGNVNITGNYQVNGTPISATSNWNQSGSTINYTAGNVSIGSSSPLGLLTVIGGNVGIGSNVPGQVLDVVGTVRATSFTGQSGHGILGTWSTGSSSCGGIGSSGCTYGTIYGPATTDGKLNGWCSASSNPTNETVSCLTDSSSTPSTIREAQTIGSTGLGTDHLTQGCGTDIRKGDYFEITCSSDASISSSGVYFIPSGS